MKNLLLILLVLIPLGARAQFTLMVVTNTASITNLIPSESKPVVLELKNNANNWQMWRYVPSSSSSYGSAVLPTKTGVGRWLATPLTFALTNITSAGVANFGGETYFTGLTQITNVLLTGTASVDINSTLELVYSMTDQPAGAATRKDYVDFQAPLIVDDLAGLLASESSPRYRIAVVLQDTASDGASGDWFFDPSSTDTESAVIKIPDDRSEVSLGRWFKR